METVSHSVKDTLGLGRSIARHLKKGDIICLCGQLGSGKTVLAKGIASGLGIKKNAVVSPSFVLIRQYASALPLYHFDFYRLMRAENISQLGYEEYLYGEGVSVVEWAERLGFLFPRECLRIDLSIRGNDRRLLKFKAKGRRYRELLKRIYPAIKRRDVTGQGFGVP